MGLRRIMTSVATAPRDAFGIINSLIPTAITLSSLRDLGSRYYLPYLPVASRHRRTCWRGILYRVHLQIRKYHRHWRITAGLHEDAQHAAWKCFFDQADLKAIVEKDAHVTTYRPNADLHRPRRTERHIPAINRFENGQSYAVLNPFGADGSIAGKEKTIEGSSG